MNLRQRMLPDPEFTTAPQQESSVKNAFAMPYAGVSP